MQTTTEISEGRATLRLEGRFELSSYRDLRDCCDCALAVHDVKELELDLAGIVDVDDAGVGVLLLMKERADIAHKRMTLSNCAESVKHLLDVANLKEIFGVP
jgi:anti-anti-sigma factor